jgi:hypothetical protein
VGGETHREPIQRASNDLRAHAIGAPSRRADDSATMRASSARKGALKLGFKKFQRCVESREHEAPMEASDVVALAPFRRNHLDHESKE